MLVEIDVCDLYVGVCCGGWYVECVYVLCVGCFNGRCGIGWNGYWCVVVCVVK